MRNRHTFVVMGIVVLAAIIGGFLTQKTWRGWFSPVVAKSPAAEALATEKSETVHLSPQAQSNLRLVSKPMQPETYWRTIQVPGMVIDRPGQSDRGVAAPAAGVVTRIHILPGDTIRPGETLFTLRLTSEYLQNSQTELFKTAKEIQLTQEQIDRVADGVRTGAISEARMMELDQQLRRSKTVLQAHRQDLLARGLIADQVNSVEQGRFVTEVTVAAPRRPAGDKLLVAAREASSRTASAIATTDLAFEVQELKVQAGEQVQAGQTLGILANHQTLCIEGRGFKSEARLLEQASEQGWNLRVEAVEDTKDDWPPLRQTLQIRNLGNTIDPASRTFPFYVPLDNQSRAYQKGEKVFLIWRFRPGQRVRLHIPVQQFQDVFVLPKDGVAREGPEAYVFRQNGDYFDRKPVHVLHEDRQNVVIAKDGGIAPGLYFAQNGTAQLNRVLKSQTTSGGNVGGTHVHADGTVHQH